MTNIPVPVQREKGLRQQPGRGSGYGRHRMYFVHVNRKSIVFSVERTGKAAVLKLRTLLGEQRPGADGTVGPRTQKMEKGFGALFVSPLGLGKERKGLIA